MKAVVHTRFGSPDVLQIVEVAKPVPRAREVLIKVAATTVTSAECAMRRGEPRWGRLIIGLRRPRKRLRTLGMEIAGEVEAVGAQVRRFTPGQQVFGFTGFGLGGYAEYTCMSEHGSLAPKPPGTTYEEAAAAVDGATTALFFLQKAKIQPGQRVLINGASGSIGTYAVQLAKHFGAEVTAVCGTRNVDLVRSLGADEVIDYTRADFTKRADAYDIIFDTVGKSSFARCRSALTRNGRYLPTTGLRNAFLALGTKIRRKKVVTGMSVKKNDALRRIGELIEADQLKIVIDRRYPLAQVAEAHRYVDTGHKRGNVVLTVEHVAG